MNKKLLLSNILDKFEDFLLRLSEKAENLKFWKFYDIKLGLKKKLTPDLIYLLLMDIKDIVKILDYPPHKQKQIVQKVYLDFEESFSLVINRKELV